MSDDEEDLDGSILHITYSIFLPFWPMIQDGPNPITSFSSLTLALLQRAFMSMQSSDLKWCIEYFHHLRDLSLEAFGIKRDGITASLMRALILQVRLGSADITTKIKEIVALCHELLSLDDLETHSTDAIEAFANLFHTHYTLELARPPLDELIQCLRAANTRLPDSHHVPLAISMCLLLRFNATRSNDDYNDAITTLDRIIATHSSADDPSLRASASDAAALAATFARNRFICFGRPDHLEEAIFRERAYLSTLSLNHPHRHASVRDLTILEGTRFDEFGVINSDAERRVCGPPIRPSFSDLAAFFVDSNLNFTEADRGRHQEAIRSIRFNIDKADIDEVEIKEAMEYCRLLLASLHPADDLAHDTTLIFGCLLFRAAECTNDTERLNSSITTFRDLLNIPSAHRLHFNAIQGVILSLFLRTRLLGDMKDVDEMMQLSSVAVSDPCPKVPERFEVAFMWTITARLFGHPSLTAALESAFSLMRDSLSFAPTLEIQHFRLVAMRITYEQLPLNYALI